MNDTKRRNCTHWKPLKYPLYLGTGEEMDSEPTDGMCDKHNKRRTNIEYCDDYESKD